MPVLQRICSSRTMLDRMMECSQQQICEIAEQGDAPQRLVASRILESARSRKHWESSHCQLLRNIVVSWSTAEQMHAIKRMGLSMIHRKAPFEYLRDRRLSGPARRRFFEVVYGREDYYGSFVREHRNYLEAGASYLCVERFCGESSMLALTDYEQRYAGYLRAQVRQLDDEHCGRHERAAAWLGYLRIDLQRQRRNLLISPPSRADSLALEKLYRSGDAYSRRTVRTRSGSSNIWPFITPSPAVAERGSPMMFRTTSMPSMTRPNTA
jgi:hypothetical protein